MFGRRSADEVWDIRSAEEIENRFCSEIFEVWALDWFIGTLNFTDDEERNDWCEDYFGAYLDKLLTVWKNPRNLDKFAESQDFLNVFIDMGKLLLGKIDFEWEISTYFRLSFAVICLFDTDKDIYAKYNAMLEPVFEMTLKQLIQKGKSNKWYIIKILTNCETESRLKDFHSKVENCQWKPIWAMDFLKFIITPPFQALYADNCSLLREDSYLTSVYNLENSTQEEREIHFCNEIFKEWGVDGFTSAIFFTEDEKSDFCSLEFKNYIENLLRVWKIPENLEKFVKCPEFLIVFIDIVKIRLQNIHFDNELYEYFRLCFVVICLFDADKQMYDDFNVNLEPFFENALKQLVHQIKSEEWNIKEFL
ncbi:unnamed protein product, partial [Allacma fusca]